MMGLSRLTSERENANVSCHGHVMEIVFLQTTSTICKLKGRLIPKVGQRVFLSAMSTQPIRVESTKQHLFL